MVVFVPKTTECEGLPPMPRKPGAGPRPPHIDDIIADAKRSNNDSADAIIRAPHMHVKSLTTPDTIADYYKPPYPTLDGDTLTVPAGSMADKVRDAWWNGANITIDGARYSVSEFYGEGKFLVDKVDDGRFDKFAPERPAVLPEGCCGHLDIKTSYERCLPPTEWHPTIGQPEAANSNNQWASGGIVMDKDYSAGTLSAISLDVGARVDPAGYRTLRTILDAAFAHAATGKGKERHARDLPFDEQPMMQTARWVGPGFPLGQAIKKAQEASGMIERGELDAAEAECLGAINYLAGAVAWMREQGKVREAA